MQSKKYFFMLIAVFIVYSKFLIADDGAAKNRANSSISETAAKKADELQKKSDSCKELSQSLALNRFVHLVYNHPTLKLHQECLKQQSADTITNHLRSLEGFVRRKESLRAKMNEVGQEINENRNERAEIERSIKSAHGSSSEELQDLNDRKHDLEKKDKQQRDKLMSLKRKFEKNSAAHDTYVAKLDEAREKLNSHKEQRSQQAEKEREEVETLVTQILSYQNNSN